MDNEVNNDDIQIDCSICGSPCELSADRLIICFSCDHVQDIDIDELEY